MSPLVERYYSRRTRIDMVELHVHRIDCNGKTILFFRLVRTIFFIVTIREAHFHFKMYVNK